MVRSRNTGPNFRSEAGVKLNQLGNEFLTELGAWFKNNPPSTIWPMCASCANMSRNNTHICKKYGLVPPLPVIVGDVPCEGYQDEESIPF